MIFSGLIIAYTNIKPNNSYCGGCMLRNITGLLFCILLVSCSSQIKLWPINSSVKKLPDAASDSVALIHVLVETQAWPGDPQIKSKVIPIRVTIQNKSGNLLRIRTSEFAFVNKNGNRYSALPPYNIKGTIEQPFNPGFTYDHFLIAPYYSSLYPNLSACPNDFMYDQTYYDTYYPAWIQRLPTAEMLRLALPDGVIDVGGYASGFLYFQNIPAKEHEIKFVAKLINAVSGDLMGTISIPFKVTTKNRHHSKSRS